MFLFHENIQATMLRIDFALSSDADLGFIQTVVPLVCLQYNIFLQRQNAQNEEGAFPKRGHLRRHRRYFAPTGDRLWQRGELQVLPRRLHGGLYRPQPTLPEIPAGEHGRKHAFDLRRVHACLWRGHEGGEGRISGRRRLHPGPLFCSERTAGSAGSPPRSQAGEPQHAAFRGC